MKTFVIAFIAAYFAHRISTNLVKVEPYVKALLSTKTPYRYIAEKNGLHQNMEEIKFPGCKAVRIWGLIRHGTRTPGHEMKKKMETRLNEIKRDSSSNCICDRSKGLSHMDAKSCVPSSIENWEPHFELDGDKRLTQEGEEELTDMGERFGTRFPELLPEEYSNDAYQFKYTLTERTKASAKSFADGLFGRRISRRVKYPSPQNKDPILRFYKCCPKWQQSVDKNASALVEKTLFDKSHYAEKAVKNVEGRLGLSRGSLNFGDLAVMYTTCGFETAWDKFRTSPWCSVFSESDLKVMEYSKDLEYYWIDGYGHDLTSKIACKTFQDMTEHLLSDDGEPPAKFYFTHSGTLLKYVAHLGLYEDKQPLRHDNFERMTDRAYRSSKIGSFANNVVFVTFECGKEKKIYAMHQEMPVKLPGCPSILCPSDTFLNVYRSSSTDCSFEQLCELK